MQPQTISFRVPKLQTFLIFGHVSLGIDGLDWFQTSRLWKSSLLIVLKRLEGRSTKEFDGYPPHIISESNRYEGFVHSRTIPMDTCPNIKKVWSFSTPEEMVCGCAEGRDPRSPWAPKWRDRMMSPGWCGPVQQLGENFENMKTPMSRGFKVTWKDDITRVMWTNLKAWRKFWK